MALLHILFMILLGGPVVLALWGYFKSRKIPVEPGSAVTAFSTKLIVNSAVLYALAYNTIFFIQELFLALGKKWLGLKAFLFHNNHSWEGYNELAPLAQGLGALAIFLLGLLFLINYPFIRKSAHWIRLFVLWLAFHGLIQSLPQIPSGVTQPSTDVGQPMQYLNIGLGWSLFLSFLAIAAIIVIGLLYSRFLLEFAPDQQAINHPIRRFRFSFQSAVLAALAGTLLVLPFRIMPFWQIISPILLNIICLPWIFANSWRVSNISPAPNIASQKVLLVPIGLLILLLIFFQVVLAPGVVFNP